MMLRSIYIATALFAASGLAATVIPTSALSSYSSFETYFNYLYPWGTGAISQPHISI